MISRVFFPGLFLILWPAVNLIEKNKSLHNDYIIFLIIFMYYFFTWEKNTNLVNANLIKKMRYMVYDVEQNGTASSSTIFNSIFCFFFKNRVSLDWPTSHSVKQVRKNQLWKHSNFTYLNTFFKRQKLVLDSHLPKWIWVYTTPIIMISIS